MVCGGTAVAVAAIVQPCNAESCPGRPLEPTDPSFKSVCTPNHARAIPPITAAISVHFFSPAPGRAVDSTAFVHYAQSNSSISLTRVSGVFLAEIHRRFIPFLAIDNAISPIKFDEYFGASHRKKFVKSLRIFL